MRSRNRSDRRSNGSRHERGAPSHWKRRGVRGPISKRRGPDCGASCGRAARSRRPAPESPGSLPSPLPSPESVSRGRKPFKAPSRPILRNRTGDPPRGAPQSQHSKTIVKSNPEQPEKVQQGDGKPNKDVSRPVSVARRRQSQLPTWKISEAKEARNSSLIALACAEADGQPT